MRTWIKTSGYLVVGALGLGCWSLAPASAQEELPQPLREKFRGLDRDGDGKLSPQELGDARAFERGDLDRDGSLSPIEAYRLHLIQSGKGLGSTQRVVDGFQQADTDQSGWLSLEEFPTGGGDFAAMDRDKDGRLTLSEAVRYQVALEMAEFLLDEDLDGDGKLSAKELPKSAQPFLSLADLDADGKLNEKELYRLVVEFRLALIEAKGAAGKKPAPKKPAPEKPAPKKPASKKPAPKKPPTRESAEAAKSFAGGKDVVSRLQAALQTLDTSGDGKLQRDEVVLSQTLLESLDRDGDRALDAAELRLAAGRRDRLVARARGVGQRLKGAGLEAKLVAIRPELEGLLAAGRLREAELLVDAVELRLLRAEQR